MPRALWHVGMEAQPLSCAQGLCTALQLVLLAVPLPANSLVPQQVLGFSLRPMRRSIASPHLSPRTLDSSFFTPSFITQVPPLPSSLSKYNTSPFVLSDC